jgi:multidrug efflux system outer membrane protein
MVVLLSACAHLDPADRAPRSDPVARLRPVGPSPWRVDFGDPTLSELLHGADIGALDIKIALARLARARADVAAAHARRAPQVSIGAEAAGGGVDFRDARSAATPTFEATYEVDLWGRLARAQDAAVQDQGAADADVATARLLVAADTVRAFATLRAAQDSVSAYVRRVTLAERGLSLTQRRAAEGAAAPEAVGAARLTLAQAQAGLAWAREDETLQTTVLADLLGQSTIVIPPGPSPTVQQAASAPSEIVASRPDVQAALARLRAADARRAEAVAASRPQLQISALMGAPDAAIATLLDARSLAWAVAASLTHQLMDGGAARARVHAASADADVADLQYRKAVLAGWSEVRTALIDGARAQRDMAAARAVREQARSGAAVEAARWQEGLVDGLDGVAAGAAIEAAEDRLRVARLNAVQARVHLALATGGL